MIPLVSKPQSVYAAGTRKFPTRLIAAVFVALALLGGYFRPLLDLIRFARHSELFSHILLIPFISAYIVWSRRKEISVAFARREAWRPSALPLAIVFVLAAASITSGFFAWQLKHGQAVAASADLLALSTTSFVTLLAAVLTATLPTETLRLVVFPLAFLIFAIPFPISAQVWLESFFQHFSAHAAYAFISLSGLPIAKAGTRLLMPGFHLDVEPQCSGIHSTLVLFITSIVGGQMLLNRHSHRILLTLAIIPLAIARNGFRIFVLAQLCAHVSVDMLDSWIHHHGGFIFFAASLVPFFALLWWMRRRELRCEKLPQ